ncbi:MAG: flagellar assembly peptidoglycan hydrolase FlgJ [Hydrogenophaga sp.]|uniref:flagellar assembly peptidoglycan hydrolase FlgJ n=1 Tax=Hydrogenophaga sp. TaxID=1904254 RepID=UPI0025C1506E|nr:flagellar assembly peptidoglycan hydrolase FlgJ [Hydrogenophaga sp.]MBT9551804.1 flagellar assembly peptidoglycan hydrolase FlgJ [Hydrogenophaga sp.]
MSSLQSTTQSLAVDPGALNALKFSAGQEGESGKAALKGAAKQFESLFMRELIKSMRDATQKSGLLEGQGSDLGTDLLDQQLSVQLSGLPGGLSEAIERQLSRQMGPKGTAEGAAPAGTGASTATDNDTPVEFKPLNRSGLRALLKYAPNAVPHTAPRTGAVQGETGAEPAKALRRSTVPTQAASGPRHVGFVAQHGQAAATVARESGIPASYMLGQAGHETGWGRSEIRQKDGTPSHNLFGIKATSSWKGKVAEVTTTEYVNGVPRKTVAKFRAYDSYADSFRDYARLITKSPRYDKAMDQIGSVQGFASSLQRAGYATDPQYAAKLSRAINMTLSVQRAQS